MLSLVKVSRVLSSPRHANTENNVFFNVLAVSHHFHHTSS
jgi:hypothetical protein